MQEEEHNPRIAMGKATKIVRKSIHTFLQNYQHFTSVAAFIAFPFSVSVLVSQAILPYASSSSSSSSKLVLTIHNRLQSLFNAAGFAPSSQFFTLLTQKLSQTISSSLFTLPFALSFLLITKASIIQSLTSSKNQSFSSSFSIYTPILKTYLFNSLLILSANATVFSLLFIAFNFLEAFNLSDSPNALLLLSSCGAVLYSIVLANALIVCNLALILSGTEKKGGYLAVLKACLVIRGRTSTALFLALPVSLGLAAIEALFQYRVVRAFHFQGKLGRSTVLEGVLIAYLYSILVVLDTIVSFMFFKSCKQRSSSSSSCWGECTDEEIGYSNLKISDLKEIS